MPQLTWLVACACWFLLLLAFATASAQGPEEKLIVLQTRGVDDIAPEFTDTLRELLSRIDMILVTADVRGRQAYVVAYVDIEASERGAIVWISDPKRNLPRLRREVPLSSSRDVFRETLAHVVLGAVETYAADAAASSPAPPTPPPAEPEVEDVESTREAAPKLLYDVSARGGPLWFAQSKVGAVFGGGFRVMLNRQLPPSWSLEAGFMLPASIEQAGVRAELQLVNVRAAQRFAFYRTSLVMLELGLGLGFDRWAFTPNSGDRAIQFEAASTRFQPMAGVMMAAYLAMTQQLALVLHAGMDLDMAPRRWVLETPRGRDTILEPSHLRPYASLAIAWTLNAPASDKERGP